APDAAARAGRARCLWSQPCRWVRSVVVGAGGGLRLERRVRIVDAHQVTRTREGAEVIEQAVAARVGVQLGHPRLRVGDVAEDDGLGGARLLAGGDHRAIRDEGAALAAGGRLPGRDAGTLDALHAVRALLHDAAGADGHVRVHRHALSRGLARRVVQVVEPAHLVGAVVRAVAGADAAVVDHHVEALLAVHRGVHRAHVLAGGPLAVHAGDGLDDGPRILELAREVAVHPQPGHLAAALDLVTADDRDVVLDLAGDDAGVAAGAAAQVDRHAPLLHPGAGLRREGLEQALTLGEMPQGLVDLLGVGLPGRERRLERDGAHAAERLERLGDRLLHGPGGLGLDELVGLARGAH